MNLIENPKTLAERLVNAVCANIYERSGGDYFFDGVDDDVKDEELIPELVAVVEKELPEPPLLQCVDCKNTESCAGAMARLFNRGRCMHCGGYFKVIRA